MRSFGLDLLPIYYRLLFYTRQNTTTTQFSDKFLHNSLQVKIQHATQRQVHALPFPFLTVDGDDDDDIPEPSLLTPALPPATWPATSVERYSFLHPPLTSTISTIGISALTSNVPARLRPSSIHRRPGTDIGNFAPAIPPIPMASDL